MFSSYTLSCICAAAVLGHPGRTGPRARRVPQIAHIAGMAVGYSSERDARRRLGPGLQYTGMHPGGAVEWRGPSGRWYLDIDGFSYSGRGLVISVATLSRASGAGAPNAAPMLRRPHGGYGWLGTVLPGSSIAALSRATRGLPAPQRPAPDKWVWTSGGYAKAERQEPAALNRQAYTQWSATVRAANGVVAAVTVRAQ